MNFPKRMSCWSTADWTDNWWWRVSIILLLMLISCRIFDVSILKFGALTEMRLYRYSIYLWVAAFYTIFWVYYLMLKDCGSLHWTDSPLKGHKLMDFARKRKLVVIKYIFVSFLIQKFFYIFQIRVIPRAHHTSLHLCCPFKTLFTWCLDVRMRWSVPGYKHDDDDVRMRWSAPGYEPLWSRTV